MTIFIYEHLTSGALAGEPLSASLQAEGNAMLKAIVDDLAALGYSLVILRDAQLPLPELRYPELVKVISVKDSKHYQQLWTDSLQRYHDFLLIAPETNNTLLQLAQQVTCQGKRLLGCNVDTIALCTDKLATSRHLSNHGLKTPNTLLAEAWTEHADNAYHRWIIKPRDGAGCEDTYLLNAEQLPHQLELTKQSKHPSIIQPYIEGQALSLSLFVTESELSLLSINIQHISCARQQLQLNHCEVNRSDILPYKDALSLSKQLHATMPGLWGFVGVDLIKTASALWIVDINPRLTSSYAETAMRQEKNPATPLHRYLEQHT